MREHTQRFDPRQTMRRPTFEIFHYKNPSQSSVAVHHHDFYEVYYFISGNVEYRVEGRIYQLEPGDMLLISPMELHQAIIENNGAPYERIVLWIDKNYLESLCSPDADLARCFDYKLPGHSNLLRLTPAQRSDLSPSLRELVAESYSDAFGANLCATGMLMRFLVELNRLVLQSSDTEPNREISSALVSQVLSYISDHYHEPLSLETLAQQFYVSKYHLSHEFSRIVGTSVYRYITLKRLQIARQMLTVGEAPGIVYANCGFGDYTNFYRAFKAQYGVSPRVYMEGIR